jgi:hypothetical protein
MQHPRIEFHDAESQKEGAYALVRTAKDTSHWNWVQDLHKKKTAVFFCVVLCWQ